MVCSGPDLVMTIFQIVDGIQTSDDGDMNGCAPKGQGRTGIRRRNLIIIQKRENGEQHFSITSEPKAFGPYGANFEGEATEWIVRRRVLG